MSEEFEYLVTADAGEPGTVLARARLAHRQAELLSALVAGGPTPPGFDPEQLRIQASGLVAKRRDTVARVAPELPPLLGGRFAADFSRYAAGVPMTGGYRTDALAFARWVLDHGADLTRHQHSGLMRWYADRAGPTAPRRRTLVRLRAPLGVIGRQGRRPGGGH
ncbi:hypothetical protein AB0761_11910 [Peterkaempfera sp. SMS 1(5)a]